MQMSGPRPGQSSGSGEWGLGPCGNFGVRGVGPGVLQLLPQGLGRPSFSVNPYTCSQ